MDMGAWGVWALFRLRIICSFIRRVCGWIEEGYLSNQNSLGNSDALSAKIGIDNDKSTIKITNIMTTICKRSNNFFSMYSNILLILFLVVFLQFLSRRIAPINF